MDVNVLSMFLTCRAVVPRMRERGGGRIVNISSGTPFRGVPFLLHYVTSKGAIVTLTRALAKELGGDEVLVNCVAPGFTMSAGVREHPEVVDALRDVSLSAADAQARPGARGRRRRRRVPVRPGRRVRHRPDDGHRRRPVLPLRLALFAHPGGAEATGATPSSTTSPPTRRTSRRPGRRPRAALDARRRRARAPGALLSHEVDLDPSTAWLHALRPRRLRAGRRRPPPHAPGPGDPLPALRADHDRQRGPGRTVRRRARRGSSAAPTRCWRRRRPTSPRPSCGCCCCRAACAGQRTIRYVDPADADKPKTQRATRLPRARAARGAREPHRRPDPRRPARAARRRAGLRRARRELPRRARRPARRAAAAHRHAPRGRRGEHGRGLRQAHRPPRASASSPAARARRTPASASTPPSRTRRRCCCSSARSRAARAGARASRSSTTARSSGRVAKWATQVDDAARLPEVLARAFWVGVLRAAPGRSSSRCRRTCSRERSRRRPTPPPSRGVAAPGAAELERAARAARGRGAPAGDRRRGRLDARRPARTSWRFARAARRARSPRPSAARTTSTTTPRSTPGTPGSRWPRRWRGASPRPTSCSRSAARLGDIPSNGCTLLDIPRPRQRLVHVHPDPDELGAVYQPELPIVSGLPAFAAAARALAPPAGAERRRELVAQARAEYEANLREHRELPGRAAARRGHGACCATASSADAILTCGAGNFTVWAHRFYAFRRFPTQLAPRSGSMGYGVPGGGRGEGRRAPSARSSAWRATATSS